MPPAASVSSRIGVSQSSERVPAERRPQQHELAVARDEEARHISVAVAGDEAFAHEQPQVAGERRIGIIDRLVLADEAAQVCRQVAGAGFERRIGKNLVRLHGVGRTREREPREAAT